MNLFFHNLSPHLIIIFICSLGVSVFVTSSPSSSSSDLRRYKSSRINDHTWRRERFGADDDDDDFTLTLSGWQLFCLPIREETVLLWFEGKTLKSVGLIWLFVDQVRSKLAFGACTVSSVVASEPHLVFEVERLPDIVRLTSMHSQTPAQHQMCSHMETQLNLWAELCDHNLGVSWIWCPAVLWCLVRTCWELWYDLQWRVSMGRVTDLNYWGSYMQLWP